MFSEVFSVKILFFKFDESKIDTMTRDSAICSKDTITAVELPMDEGNLVNPRPEQVYTFTFSTILELTKSPFALDDLQS